jgi:hypothetical protein
MKASNKTSLRAIPKPQLEAITTTELSSLKAKVLGLMSTFAQQVSPASTLDLEQDLFSNLLSFANGLVSKLFHLLEAAPDQQPTHVRYRDQNYRRLNDRTPRQIVTRFGKITLQRSRYRRGHKSKPELFTPTGVWLGI